MESFVDAEEYKENLDRKASVFSVASSEQSGSQSGSESGPLLPPDFFDMGEPQQHQELLKIAQLKRRPRSPFTTSRHSGRITKTELDQLPQRTPFFAELPPLSSPPAPPDTASDHLDRLDEKQHECNDSTKSPPRVSVGRRGAPGRPPPIQLATPRLGRPAGADSSRVINSPSRTSISIEHSTDLPAAKRPSMGVDLLPDIEAVRASVNGLGSTSPVPASREVIDTKRKSGWFSHLFSSASPVARPAGQGSKRVRVKRNHKGEHILNDLHLSQTINIGETGTDNNSIWCAKFNHTGDYLATGGQDTILRVWTVLGSKAQRKRRRQEAEEGLEREPPDVSAILDPVPFRKYAGHKYDIIDIDWSRGDFILSASMDSTVMLWHVSKGKCLQIFEHADFVTTVRFHPVKDHFFVSGSFDQRIRLWNILENRVIDWHTFPALVTSCAFAPNGKFLVIGLFDGTCVFFTTNYDRNFELRYFTQIEARNRRGRFAKGRKVTGLYYSKSGDDARDEHGADQLLVSTNDSRMRIYNTGNYHMCEKLKGHTNTELQIQATFSSCGRFIISGSDNKLVYVWRSESTQERGERGDTNDHYESFEGSESGTPVAMFAPRRAVQYAVKAQRKREASEMEVRRADGRQTVLRADIRHIIVTANYAGTIKVFVDYQ